MSNKTSQIKIDVQLDEDQVPESMDWSAEDGGINHSPTKAALLSVWDSKDQETLRIDLWTKDMPADEMKKFLHQNLLAIADTMSKATGEDSAAADIREFARELGKKLQLF